MTKGQKTATQKGKRTGARASGSTAHQDADQDTDLLEEFVVEDEFAEDELDMARLLDAEWTRINFLLQIAEAQRSGTELSDAFSGDFASISDDLHALRGAGAWIGLRALLQPEMLNNLCHMDLDILAFALVGDASPVIATRVHALQPHIDGQHISLALLQEVLLLDEIGDMSFLLQRLEANAPLMSNCLVTLEGTGTYQTIRPGPGIARAVLGRSLDLGPPPGADQEIRKAQWSDLVTSSETGQSLQEYLTWIRTSSIVYDEWQGLRVGGPVALFCGQSGTGKTLAARVIATELDWPLFTLDLGRIVSKYVGETEKNLNRLLDALHGRNAVLQIDEADALLGKRGEISDARDRYANLEVSHLLSRLERHDGPIILTTNLRGNIDSAFLRRFQVVVDFDTPDGFQRTDLWQRLVPAKAPLDQSIEWGQIGETINLPGGSIQNAVTFAAMLAADANSKLEPRHIARAVYREIAKGNRGVKRREMGCLAQHLEQGELQ